MKSVSDASEFWGHCPRCGETIVGYHNPDLWEIKCSKCGWRPPNWQQALIKRNERVKRHRADSLKRCEMEGHRIHFSGSVLGKFWCSKCGNYFSEVPSNSKVVVAEEC